MTARARHRSRGVAAAVDPSTLPVVALVGRPNVGKSALFNRIIGERRAVVEDLPGTTRDRLYAETTWAGRDFRIVDTGGFEAVDTGLYSALVREQVKVALEEADVVLLLVDAAVGRTPVDDEVAELLRPAKAPVLVVANKADNAARRAAAAEFYALGLGEPHPVSALHGAGVADLLDELTALLPPRGEAPPEAAAQLALAIVGRPNVGKSTLLNALVGEPRAIVSDIPGTTRDAFDTVLRRDGQTWRLIDTAGIRRRGRIERGVERHSVMRAEDAIGRCDVAALLLDGPEGVTAQDTHIAGQVADAAKGLVVAINKWDAMPPGTDRREESRRVLQRLRFVPWAQVCCISAQRGEGIAEVLRLAAEAAEARHLRVTTGELNRVIQRAVAAHAPRATRGRRLRVYYATQASADPPTFALFVNDAALLHFSYRRYLENRLREAFGFTGTAIRMLFRSRDEHP